MCAVAPAAPAWRKPITGIADCCPRAASGHAAAPPSREMKSRLLPRNCIQKIPVESMTAVSSMRVRAAHGNSFDHLVGVLQERLRDGEAKRLRCLEVDD